MQNEQIIRMLYLEDFSKGRDEPFWMTLAMAKRNGVEQKIDGKDKGRTLLEGEHWHPTVTLFECFVIYLKNSTGTFKMKHSYCCIFK